MLGNERRAVELDAMLLPIVEILWLCSYGPVRLQRALLRYRAHRKAGQALSRYQFPLMMPCRNGLAHMGIAS